MTAPGAEGAARSAAGMGGEGLHEAFHALRADGFVVMNCYHCADWWKGRAPAGWIAYVRRPGGVESGRGQGATLEEALRNAHAEGAKRGLGPCKDPGEWERTERIASPLRNAPKVALATDELSEDNLF